MSWLQEFRKKRHEQKSDRYARLAERARHKEEYALNAAKDNEAREATYLEDLSKYHLKLSKAITPVSKPTRRYYKRAWRSKQLQ